MKLHGASAFGFKLDRKLVEVYLVSRRVWADVALWRTSRSGLQGWRLRFFRYGFRFTNPIFGFSVGVWV